MAFFITFPVEQQGIEMNRDTDDTRSYSFKYDGHQIIPFHFIKKCVE